MAEMITVQVRAFAGLREALAVSSLAVPIAAGTDVAGLMAHLAAAYPDARLADRPLTVAVNRSYAARERVLQDGDEVALLPPVSGGSGKLFEITERPLSLDEVAARGREPSAGASRSSPAPCAA